MVHLGRVKRLKNKDNPLAEPYKQKHCHCFEYLGNINWNQSLLHHQTEILLTCLVGCDNMVLIYPLSL